jgi:hypothetical protein
MTVNEMGWMWRKKNWRKQHVYVRTITHTATAPCNLKDGHGEAHRHINVEDYHQQVNYIKIG